MVELSEIEQAKYVRDYIAASTKYTGAMVRAYNEMFPNGLPLVDTGEQES